MNSQSIWIHIWKWLYEFMYIISYKRFCFGIWFHRYMNSQFQIWMHELDLLTWLHQSPWCKFIPENQGELKLRIQYSKKTILNSVLRYVIWFHSYEFITQEFCLNSFMNWIFWIHVSEFIGVFIILYMKHSDSQTQLNTINLNTHNPYSSIKVSSQNLKG